MGGKRLCETPEKLERASKKVASLQCQSDVPELLAVLEDLVQDSNWTGAINCAQDVLKTLDDCPSEKHAMMRAELLCKVIGIAFVKQGRYDEAAQSFERGLSVLNQVLESGNNEESSSGQSIELENRTYLNRLYIMRLTAHKEQPSTNPCTTINSLVDNSRRIAHLCDSLSRPEGKAKAYADVAECHFKAKLLPDASAWCQQCLVACQEYKDDRWAQQLMFRLLPLAVEAMNMQDRFSEAHDLWCQYAALQRSTGRNTPDECAICAESMGPSTPLMILSCGHSFHRMCCDEWFCRRLLADLGAPALCPICKQIDTSYTPSAAAHQVLEEQRRQCYSSDEEDDVEEEESESDEDDSEMTNELIQPETEQQQ